MQKLVRGRKTSGASLVDHARSSTRDAGKMGPQIERQEVHYSTLHIVSLGLSCDDQAHWAERYLEHSTAHRNSFDKLIDLYGTLANDKAAAGGWFGRCRPTVHFSACQGHPSHPHPTLKVLSLVRPPAGTGLICPIPYLHNRISHETCP